MHNFFVIFGDQRDQSLFQYHNADLLSVIKSRSERYTSALNTHLTNSEFSSNPLPSLQELEITKTLAQNMTWDSTVSSTLTKEQYIQQIQDAIDNGNYASEGTSQWDYKQQYNASVENFDQNIWPDEAEQQLRGQEDAQLNALLA